MIAAVPKTVTRNGPGGSSPLIPAKLLNSYMRFRIIEQRVGKLIGGCIYVHISAIHSLPQKELKSALEVVGGQSPGNMIKYCPTKNSFTFLYSPDWDTADEPMIDFAIMVKDGKSFRRDFKGNKPVYHHKWMFVDTGYQGFDTNESKERSKMWLQKKKEYESSGQKLGSIGFQRQWELAKRKLNI